MNTDEARRRLIRVARRLDAKGILTSTDGNLSVRLDGGALLITPSGSCKGELEEFDLVVVHADGRVEGAGRPSSEIAMHRAIYARRADVAAIAHAHPVHATAYAVAGIALDQPILSEVVLTLGAVPVVPYGTPTGDDLARSVEPFLDATRALLLRFHGAVTFAATIERAGHLMETVEHVAAIDFIRRKLGSSEVLPPAAVEELERIRKAIEDGNGR